MAENTSAPIIIPNPDPSALTTALVEREISLLKEMVNLRLMAVESAAATFAEGLTRVPTVLDREIEKVSELTAERFRSIDNRFTERDVRAEKVELAQKEFAAAQAVASGVANTVALSAQKEQAAAQSTFFAATMAERQGATTKQIDATTALLATYNKATDDKLAEINRRLDRGEGMTVNHSSSQATMIALGSLAVSMIIGAVSIVTAITHQNAPVSYQSSVPAGMTVMPNTKP